MANPTDEAYTELRQAFDHFNQALFGGKLEVPMFTFQRSKRTFGFHSKKSFVSRSTGEMVDEIAMNPAYFAVRTIKQTLSTLAHEMVHQWQDAFGHPGRGRYHNKEWAFKMREIGLEPTDTGEPGGKDVGDQVTHFVVQGGKFDVACDALLTRQFQISWLDRYPAERPHLRAKPTGDDLEHGLVTEDLDDVDADVIETMGMVEMPPEEAANKSNRVGFTCLICHQNVWGKPATVVLCGMPECRGAPMTPGTSRKKKKTPE
jgi:predicted SprT family Zn-dependent metalloprotease